MNPLKYFRFHYTSTSPHNGFVREDSAIFENQAAFERELRNWNRQDWVYEVTSSDAGQNAAPEPFDCFEAEYGAMHSIEAWNSFGHCYVVAVEDAIENARYFRTDIESVTRRRIALFQ